MGPEAWRRRIGDAAWNEIVKQAGLGNPAEPDGDTLIADVLSAAEDMGFRAPEQPPRVDPTGTKLWPVEGTGPVLTRAGLEEYWAGAGRAWILLRTEQLCRSANLARLTELLAAYEEQCAIDKVPADDARWPVVVVGGARAAYTNELVEVLREAVRARVRPPPARASVAGPGGRRDA